MLKYASTIVLLLTVIAVADTGTNVPSGGSGTGLFSRFDPPEIDGDSVVFVAQDGSTPPKLGVYRYAISTSTLNIIADSGTSIPTGSGGEGQFVSFQSATLDGSSVAFVGNGPKSLLSPLPNNQDIHQPGLYTWDGSSFATIANEDVTVPSPTGPTATHQFDFLLTPAYDSGKIAFEGWQTAGGDERPLFGNDVRRHGLYLDLDYCSGSTHELIKIINTLDVFVIPFNDDFPDQSDIEDMHIGREGLNGNPSGPNEVAKVAFYVRFKTEFPQQPDPNLKVRRAIYVAVVTENCP